MKSKARKSENHLGLFPLTDSVTSVSTQRDALSYSGRAAMLLIEIAATEHLGQMILTLLKYGNE